MVTELNPNNAVTQEVREQWHKLCALAMFITGNNQVEIRQSDLRDMQRAFPGGPCVIADARGGRFVLRLVDMAEGERLAREEGGLPV